MIMLWNKLKQIKIAIALRKILESDDKLYIKYCSDTPLMLDSLSSLERDIMVSCHTIEKAVSHRKIRPLFGYDVILKLYEDLMKYMTLNDRKKYIIELAASVINEYNKINLQLGVKSDKLLMLPNTIKNLAVIDVGAYCIDESKYFSETMSSFEKFSNSRHSIRLYDCISENISEEILMDSIKLAQNCPSACNRQATRVYIVKNREKIRSIAEIQGGCRGFGENAGALLMIFGDLRYYTIREKRLLQFDSGLFTMNLVYALHFFKLGSCILNGSFTKEQETKLNSIIDIPPYEMLTAIIAVNNVPSTQTLKIAKSEKLDLCEVVKVV